MEERRLGPVVGLGTYQTFLDDLALASDVVGAAFAAGSTVFDSSPMYGPAEGSLGVALQDRRICIPDLPCLRILPPCESLEISACPRS